MQPETAILALSVSPATGSLHVGSSQWFEVKAKAVPGAWVRYHYVVRV
jgi:hypothetical protein